MRAIQIGLLLLMPFVSTATAQEAGDPRLGGNLARRECSGCHAVEPNQRLSPAANAPTFRTLARTPGMTATALTVALRSSHKTMPNLMFEPDELRNLSAYILSLKADD